MELGRVGVWSGVLRQARPEVYAAAAELEDLGYGTIWFPGREPAGLGDHVEAVLGAMRNAVVATGIVSIWTHPPRETAAMHYAVTQAHPRRFLLGIGVSHRPNVEGAGITYERPLEKLSSYLDELDTAPTPVPVDERILASLGPRSLELARDRSAGTHPYFVPVEHTRVAREVVGRGKLVAPELMVVLETDAARARAIARLTTERYLNLPNYRNNLLRLGYPQAELANGGSDRLVDAIVAWGDAARIAARVREHHAAGADHVCIQVLTEPAQDVAAVMQGWRTLAPEVTQE